MKSVQTAIVFDQGNLTESEGWATTYRICSGVIQKLVNPPAADRFRIRARTRKLDSRGRKTSQWNRNGVTPIKSQFFAGMAKAKWKTEHKLSLESYQRINRNLQPLLTYPDRQPLSEEIHSSVGDFDFAYETDSGLLGGYDLVLAGTQSDGTVDRTSRHSGHSADPSRTSASNRAFAALTTASTVSLSTMGSPI